jgi:N-acyl-D-aspartate/D-glutamate deacylase
MDQYNTTKRTSMHNLQKLTLSFSPLNLLLAAILLCALPLPGQASDYSLVINHGRVIDPETGLDATRHLGIQGDRITAISETPLEGARTINASGLVVAPGFIDLHTHSPTDLGQYYQLFDGVTTALELEAGTYPVGEYAGQIQDHALINYGASAGYITMRLLEMDGIAAGNITGTPSPVGFRGWMTALRFLFTDFQTALARTFTEHASKEELAALRARLNEGLDQGGLGIGLALDYISEAVDSPELEMIFEVSGQRQAPIFVHIRRGINGDPAGLREVLGLAEKYKTPLHICHISHNAMRNIELFLSEIREAQSRGVDVSTEVLPYNAGSTLISAAVFGRDWQTIFDISYEDVEWAATGERFNQAMFEEYRANHPTGAVIHHYLDEAWTLRAIQEPGVIIVSDLITMKSKEENVPPHNGAFTRILGRYVREQQAIDLSTALSKMTLLPAQRLQAYAPAFKKKGRIQLDMDADLTIFDPDTVLDQATYRNPYQEAQGIVHVVVAGQAVVNEGKLVPETWPGKRILASGTD